MIETESYYHTAPKTELIFSPHKLLSMVKSRGKISPINFAEFGYTDDDSRRLYMYFMYKGFWQSTKKNRKLYELTPEGEKFLEQVDRQLDIRLVFKPIAPGTAGQHLYDQFGEAIAEEKLNASYFIFWGATSLSPEPSQAQQKQ